MKRPLIFAHRGYHQTAPENSPEAFLAAEKIGVDGIELDVRVTCDNIPVVCHDPGFTSADGDYKYIDRITGSQAEQSGIPLLETVLSGIADGTRINIEIKAEPDIPRREAGRLVRAIAAVLQRQPEQSVPMISSFHPEVINRIKELLPGTPAGWIVKPFGSHKGRPRRFDFIHPHYLLAHPLSILWHRIRKREIYVWTVNHSLMARLLALSGVDGLITDRPADFLRLFH